MTPAEPDAPPGPPSGAGPPYGSAFFIHVMKTGGTSFLHQARANLDPEQIWPGPADRAGAELGFGVYTQVEALRALPPERRAAIRFYAAHMPSVAARIVGATTTLTMLRDPVDRAISFLRHAKRYNVGQAERTLDEIYADRRQRGFFISDYQVRQFAKREDDDLSHISRVRITRSRAELARRNLAGVDVVGLQEDSAGFERRVAEVLGWRLVGQPRLRTGDEGVDVPPGLRERIADDNRADLEFYAYAVGLVARRASGAGAVATEDVPERPPRWPPWRRHRR